MNIKNKDLEFIKPLIETIENIEYGWIDKSNNKHYIVDEKYANNYKLQSPEEITKTKIGVCWDQVELERSFFENIKIPYQTYFLVHYDNDKCPTHTFLTFKLNNKFYWFEHSWRPYKGIHEYQSLIELLKDVKEKFIINELENNYNEENLILREYPKPNYNISTEEFYKHCETGNIINI